MTYKTTTLKQINKVLELKKKNLVLRDISKLSGVSHETARKIIQEFKKVENQSIK